jgi:hypothetical protein
MNSYGIYEMSGKNGNHITNVSAKSEKSALSKFMKDYQEETIFTLKIERTIFGRLHIVSGSGAKYEAIKCENKIKG